MSEMPDWKRADLIALGQVVDEPAVPVKEKAARKTATEKAVKE